jgi:tetratricopeptide (TPR) repeat protein
MIRAIGLGLVACGAIGCASLGFGERDPMRAELRRLDEEQRRLAAEERAADEEADAKARAERPQTVAERLARGDARLASGRIGEALWDYAAAYRLDPRAAAPRERLGYVHLRQNPERAQPLFESALELEPDSVSGHIGLGLSLLASGDRDGGLRHLERAVELAPDSAKAQAALGVSLDQVGRRQEALAHLERAHELRPRDARISNNLGVAYLRASQPERAEVHLRAALREDNRDVALRSNNLGMALALQGRFPEALDWFRRGGDEQGARSNLGYAHYVRGDYPEAIAEYERALLIGGPANVEVVRNLEAARRARDHAGRSPAPVPSLASDAPKPSLPRVDPAAVADEDAPPAGHGDPWLAAPPSDVPN